MNLLLLAPKIQEALLFLDVPGQPGPTFSEREVRSVVQIVDWSKQEAASKLHV
jgi:hypothetical protein